MLQKLNAKINVLAYDLRFLNQSNSRIVIIIKESLEQTLYH